MKIHRSLIAIAGITTLALAGCSSDGDDASTTSTAAETSASSEAPSTGLTDAKVGDAITEDNTTFTIHSISTGAECDYGSIGEVPPGAKLVQIRAEVQNDNTEGWFVFDPTAVVNEDGSDKQWPDDMRYGGDNCQTVPGDDDYIDWGGDIEGGDHAYVYGAFAVPEDSQYLNIRDHKFEIPEDYIDDVEGPGTGAATNPDGGAGAATGDGGTGAATGSGGTGAATGPADNAAAPYVVECLPGTPGPAMWSDGEMRPADECSDPAAAQAEGDATARFWEENPHLLEDQ